MKNYIKRIMKGIAVILIFIVGGTIFGEMLESMFDTGDIGIGAGVVSLIFLIISIVSAVNARKNIADMNSVNGLPASIWSALSMLLIMIIGFWNPPNDGIYYGAVIIAGICIIINILGIIKNYNLLAMRPLPQFEMYHGGDDRG